MTDQERAELETLRQEVERNRKYSWKLRVNARVSQGTPAR